MMEMPRTESDRRLRRSRIGAAARAFVPRRGFALFGRGVLPGLAAAATSERLAGIVHPERVDEVRAGALAVLAAEVGDAEARILAPLDAQLEDDDGLAGEIVGL